MLLLWTVVMALWWAPWLPLWLLLRRLLLWQLPWLLRAVVRRSKEDRGNAAAGDLGEGG